MNTVICNNTRCPSRYNCKKYYHHHDTQDVTYCTLDRNVDDCFEAVWDEDEDDTDPGLPDSLP